MAPRLRDLLGLVRVSSFATPAFDVVSGAAIASAATETPIAPIRTGFLAVGSVLLYWTGLIVNDLADLEKDRVERPGRPLPSGRVSIRFARRLAVVLAAGPLAIGAVAGFAVWVCVAATLVAVLVYDLFAKRWPIPAGVSMGACRGLDLTIGAVAVAGVAGVVGAAAVAIGYGLYIACVTWVGRFEAARLPAAPLFAAAAAASLLPVTLAWLAFRTGGSAGVAVSTGVGHFVLGGFSVVLAVSAWRFRGRRGAELAGAVREWVGRAVLGILFLHAGLLLVVGQPILAIFAVLAWVSGRSLAARFSAS